MIEVVPAIIPEDLEEIENKISLVKDLVKKVQLDFIDGKYAPSISWPFNLARPESDFRLPFCEEVILEADLFIKHPEDFIDDFIKIGIKSFVVHLDSTKYLDKCVHNIKTAGLTVGLGIRPSGDFDLLGEFVEKADFVQFMGNDKVGYNGVELDRKVLHKISHFRAAHAFMPIQVDIGVNPRTASELAHAGATHLVSSSAVYGNNKIKENIEKLKNN